MRWDPRGAGGAQRLLPPTPDQAPLSAPVLVFPVSERKHLPAFALEERASRVPNRFGSAEDYLLTALFTEKDNSPRRTDHDYPLGLCSFAAGTLSHPLGRHKVNLPRLHATFALPTAA